MCVVPFYTPQSERKSLRTFRHRAPDSTRNDLMKRILFFIVITGLLFVSGGCSTNNGLLGGGLVNSGFNNCGNASGLFSGRLLRSDILQDGPVRQWLRGDACDSCNVPSGQISFDSGFDPSCTTCGNASAPVISTPTTNFYPSHGTPALGGTNFGESLPSLPSIAPIEGTIGTGGISDSPFFGGGNDSVELPPLSGF